MLLEISPISHRFSHIVNILNLNMSCAHLQFREMGSTVFSNIMIYFCDLCNICIYFPVVYSTMLLVANTIICQILWYFINKNCKQSLANHSCSISGI